MTTVVPVDLTGELWTFEQKQGILYIHVPIRMTVYRMTTQKGLFVYAPVAPTAECLRLLRELEEEYGEVRHIVLPTVAVEHKPLSGIGVVGDWHTKFGSLWDFNWKLKILPKDGG